MNSPVPATQMPQFATMDRKVVRPFVQVALLWAAAGVAICLYASKVPGLACGWMLVIWALSLADLAALGQVIASLFRMSSDDPMDKPASAIQTLSWGGLKLACLALFILILLRGEAIPTVGLLIGLATLVVVPLLGGLLWSRAIDTKDFRHA